MSKLAGHDFTKAMGGQTHEHDGYPPHSHDASPNHTAQGLKRDKRVTKYLASEQLTNVSVIIQLDDPKELPGCIRILAGLALARGIPPEDLHAEIFRAEGLPIGRKES